MSKTKTAEYNGKPVQTLDMTPTWEGMLGYYLLVLEDGNAEGKKIAKEELRKMAKVADMVQPEREAAKKLLNDVDTAFATLFIGADHGITSQAMSACKQAAIDVQIALGYRDADGKMIEEQEPVKYNGVLYTHAQITEMRNWAKDCQWNESEDSEFINELSDVEILKGVQKHYEGGLPAFIQSIQSL